MSQSPDSLSSPKPTLSAEEAVVLAESRFGVRGTAYQLTSERDANFRIRTADGAGYVLKLANPAEEEAVTNLQTMALLHIAQRDPDLPVQRVFPSLSGRHEEILTDAEGRPMVLRLFSYLEGTPLHQVPRSPTQRRNLGAHLARLTCALADFSHSATHHDLQWDIKHAHRLWDLLPYVEAGARRGLVEQILRNFDEFALPAMPQLRAHFVHNDLNPYNVLVAEEDHDRIAGILDFGDMVWTPLVNDLAVASSYQLALEGNPLEDVAEFIGAYHAVLPLEAREIDLLYDLIAARMATTICIASWRASRYPENRDYILRNAPRAWAGIEAFARLPREAAQAQLRRACVA
ncbi:Ser/Thr protein kinase RdoA (MazF antagonist) [Dongia mobilis]|uniref:Hydroxylysine kinase n=1 Tax=Dongia mobilis TaxID=578943 RepID=A0A4V3DEK5_9PROT|nr:phosphotransferase [Dongia mobilis]TDQ80902.1 Ser/Thr protein kinase RdoA (MazF antagonist) [Dongia mobilis]